MHASKHKCDGDVMGQVIDNLLLQSDSKLAQLEEWRAMVDEFREDESLLQVPLRDAHRLLVGSQ